MHTLSVALGVLLAALLLVSIATPTTPTSYSTAAAACTDSPVGSSHQDRPLPLGALHSLQLQAAPDQPTVLTRRPRHTPTLRGRRTADLDVADLDVAAKVTEDDDGWVVVFEEGFDGTTINQTRWNVRNNYTHGNQELSMYMTDHVYLQDGNMVLRTDRTTLHANNGRF
jgi:hypothetical protein